MDTSSPRSRSSLALALGLTLALLVQPGAVVSEPGTAIVPTYRGDAGRTGVMPGPGPMAPPRIAWRASFPHRLTSSPTLSDGLLHVVSGDGFVHGLQLADGDERWVVDLGAHANATPVIAGGVLVLGDEGGVLHGLEPSDGTAIWRTQLDGPVTGSPAHDDGMLVVATAVGAAYGIDPQDGLVRWSTPVGGPVRWSVAMANGAAYVGVTPGTIVALASADGRELWRRQVAPEGDVLSPSVANGRVHVAIGHARSGRISVLDATTGALLWGYEAPQGVTARPPALADGRAFVVRDDGLVEALDGASGEVRWSTSVPGPMDALPAIVDDELIVATTDGLVRALDLATGIPRWDVEISDGPWAPIAAEGYVLVPTLGGTLYALTGQS